jgi:hypothetical protein
MTTEESTFRSTLKYWNRGKVKKIYRPTNNYNLEKVVAKRERENLDNWESNVKVATQSRWRLNFAPSYP